MNRTRISVPVVFGKLKKQSQEYGIVKRNVDSILHPVDDKPKVKEKER